MDADLIQALRGLKDDIKQIKWDAEREYQSCEDREDAAGADEADEIVGYCEVVLQAIAQHEMAEAQQHEGADHG